MDIMENCEKSGNKLTKKDKAGKYVVGKWGFIFHEKRVAVRK